jgi:hypothetical protein
MLDRVEAVLGRSQQRGQTIGAHRRSDHGARSVDHLHDLRARDRQWVRDRVVVDHGRDRACARESSLVHGAVHCDGQDGIQNNASEGEGQGHTGDADSHQPGAQAESLQVPSHGTSR